MGLANFLERGLLFREGLETFLTGGFRGYDRAGAFGLGGGALGYTTGCIVGLTGTSSELDSGSIRSKISRI